MNKEAFLKKYEVDLLNQSITFSCATQNPCERYDQETQTPYLQILVINEESVNMDRLNNKAALLFNHDTDKLIGVVEKAWVQDQRVFVRVRFSTNDDFSKRVWADLVDGIIAGISIGYTIDEYKDVQQDGINKRYVTKFMIYQVSCVSIPADTSCNLRQLNTLHKDDIKMSKKSKKEIEKEVIAEEQEAVKEPEKEVEVEVEKETVEEPEKEVEIDKEEVKEQTDENGETETVEYDEENKIKVLEIENEELKAQIKELQAKQCTEQEEKQCTVDDTENNREEIEKIGEDFGVAKDEVERAIANKLTVREFKNKIKSLNFNVKIKEQKNMNTKQAFRDYLQAGNFDKSFTFRDFTGFGGEGATALIGTDTKPLVQALKLKMGLTGFSTLSGLHNNVSIPVQTTRNVVYQTGLNEAATTSNPGFTAVTLSPVKISGNTVIGKDLLTQCNDDIVAFVIDSLQKEIAYKIEDYMLAKVVASNPTEINYSSLGAIDWNDICAMQAALDGFDLGEPQYVMSPSAKAILKATPKTANYPDFLCSADNYINGYKCNVSGCVGNDNIYFADWSKLILGVFGEGMDVITDIYSLATYGQVRIVASICIDSAVLDKNAFCIGKVQSESSSSTPESSAAPASGSGD